MSSSTGVCLTNSRACRPSSIGGRVKEELSTLGMWKELSTAGGIIPEAHRRG